MLAVLECLCVLLVFLTGSSDATRFVGGDALLSTMLNIDSKEAAIRYSDSETPGKVMSKDLLAPLASTAQLAITAQPLERAKRLQYWFTTFFSERYVDKSKGKKATFRVALVSGAAAWASGSRPELSDLDCWIYGIRSWKRKGLVLDKKGEAENQMHRDAEGEMPEIDAWDPVGDKFDRVALFFQGHRDELVARGPHDKVRIMKMGWAEQLAFKLALITGGRGLQNGAYKVKLSDFKDLAAAVFAITESDSQLGLWEDYVRSQAIQRNPIFTKKGFSETRQFLEINGEYKGRVHVKALSAFFTDVDPRYIGFFNKWSHLLT